MINRRGEYALDGHYPRLGVLAQATLEVAAGAVTARAAAAGRSQRSCRRWLGCGAASYLYSTRRGKFEVWAELLDELDLRGDEHVLDIGCGSRR